MIYICKLHWNQRLDALSTDAHFHPGDFLRAVRVVAGEKAASLSREVLREKFIPEGPLLEHHDEFASFNRIMEGCCMVISMS